MFKLLKRLFGLNGNTALRPLTFEEFIGQKNIKRSLEIATKAAKARNETIEHILLSGPPGLGKTTLANIIANELQSNVHITSGPMVKSPKDLAELLEKLEKFDILFIDEIHRISMKTEEVVYSAMEDFKIDLLDKKEGTITITIPTFTLIGATTLLGDLSEPFRARFGIVCEMQYYTFDEMKLIIKRSAKQLGASISSEAAEEIARRCRRTPRIANKFLRRARDIAEVEGNGNIELVDVLESFKLIGIDKYGLSRRDRQILKVLYEKGTAGLNVISSVVRENESTIEQVHEPYLMQEGFIDRSSKGRELTKKGHKYVDHLLQKVKRND